VHRESNLITVQQGATYSVYYISAQQGATYSVYYISVGSSICFGCRHPSSGARTTVITDSGVDSPDLLTSALLVKLELIHVYSTVGIPTVRYT